MIYLVGFFQRANPCVGLDLLISIQKGVDKDITTWYCRGENDQMISFYFVVGFNGKCHNPTKVGLGWVGLGFSQSLKGDILFLA